MTARPLVFDWSSPIGTMAPSPTVLTCSERNQVTLNKRRGGKVGEIRNEFPMRPRDRKRDPKKLTTFKNRNGKSQTLDEGHSFAGCRGTRLTGTAATERSGGGAAGGTAKRRENLR